MLNQFLQYYRASAVPRLLVLDRRQPPLGSNHDLANSITRGIIISAGILAMIMSIAGLLMADTVSHISLGFAGIVTVLLVSWISRWESISTATNRRFVLIALALVQGRYLTGWLVTDAADAPGAILTGLIYTPLILFVAALYEGHRRGIIIGLTSAILMGGTIIVGSQRPEMAEIHFNDWRLGLIVGFSISAYTFILGLWSEQQSILEDSSVQLLRLERAANTDPLTQLLNRRGLDVIVERWVADSDKMGVLLLDIDHFKTVNDDYGHDIGDQALRKISNVIRATSRDDDVVARWGGEELLVITRSSDKPALKEFSERLRKAVSDINIAGLPPLTVSIGVTQHFSHEAFEQSTLVRADEALYTAKNEGRNLVRYSW